MSDETRVLAGILLLALVTVETGGMYLVKLVRGAEEATPFQLGFARAGHAHAGVLVILTLVGLLLVDQADLSNGGRSLVRYALVAGPILMPLGFFLSIASPRAQSPNQLIYLVPLGGVSLGVGAVVLGLGLLSA